MGYSEAEKRLKGIAYTVPGLIKGEVIPFDEALQILREEFNEPSAIDRTPTVSTKHNTKGKSRPATMVVYKGLSERSTEDTSNPSDELKNTDRLGTGKVPHEDIKVGTSARRISRPKQSRKGQEKNAKKSRKSPAKGPKRT